MLCVVAKQRAADVDRHAEHLLDIYEEVDDNAMYSLTFVDVNLTIELSFSSLGAHARKTTVKQSVL